MCWVQAVATLEGNKLTLVHASERAGDIRRELEFSDTGIIMVWCARAGSEMLLWFSQYYLKGVRIDNYI